MIYHDRRKIINNEKVNKVSNLVYSKGKYNELFYLKANNKSYTVIVHIRPKKTHLINQKSRRYMLTKNSNRKNIHNQNGFPKITNHNNAFNHI